MQGITKEERLRKVSEKLDSFQKAAASIEKDGVLGVGEAAKICGNETAIALLVAHLRREFGSMNPNPPDSAIIERKVVEDFAIAFEIASSLFGENS